MDIHFGEIFTHGKRVASVAALFLACFILVSGAGAQTPAAARTTGEDEVFLKAFYALDEPRFLCVDISGHRDCINLYFP
jgi:hypothetical protein